MLQQEIVPKEISQPAMREHAHFERPQATRNLGVDAYRGFRDVPHDGGSARTSLVWPNATRTAASGEFLGYHQSTSTGLGCSLHDLIQPSFSFLVGVGAAVLAGQPPRERAVAGPHVPRTRCGARCCWFVLGSSSAPVVREQTNFTFEDTLTQIGLGYPFLFLLGFRPRAITWIALAAHPGRLLGGIRVCIRSPAADFDYTRVGVPPDWPLPCHRDLPPTGTRTAIWPGPSTLVP